MLLYHGKCFHLCSGELVSIGNTIIIFIVRLFVIDEQMGSTFVEGPILCVLPLHDQCWLSFLRFRIIITKFRNLKYTSFFFLHPLFHVCHRLHINSKIMHIIIQTFRHADLENTICSPAFKMKILCIIINGIMFCIGK